MKRALRVLLWLTGSLLVLVLAGVLALPRFLDLSAEIPVIEAKAAELLGRPVAIERLTLDLSHGVGLRAHHLVVGGIRGGQEEALRVEAVTFVIKLRRYLFDDTIELAGLRLRQPSIKIERRQGELLPANLLSSAAQTGSEEMARDWQGRLEQFLQNAPVEFLQIEQGRLLLVTHRAQTDAPKARGGLPTLSTGPLVTQVSDISLNISSLRPYTPIEFELAGTIEPGGGAPGSFEIDGSWTFRSSDYRLDEAQLALRAKFADLDTNWLADVPAWKSAGLERGRISGKFSMVGTPFSEISAEGEMVGRNIRGSWPALWAVPLEPDTLRLPFEFERHDSLYELRLRKADINGLDVRRMRMTFAFDEKKPEEYDFAMDLEVEDAIWERHFEYYPWIKLDDPVRSDLRRRIARQGGADYVFVAQQARYNGKEFVTDWDQTRIEADLHHMRMRVGQGEEGPTLTDLTGKLLFQKGGLFFDHMDGRVDEALALQFNGGFPALVENSKLDLAVSGRVPLGRLAEVAPRYGFPALRDAFAPLRKSKGTIEANAKLSFDLEAGDFNYQGTLRFARLQVPAPVIGLDLSDLEGEILFSHERLESSLLRARAGGSPVRFSFAVGTPQGERPEFRLSLDGEDLDLASLLGAWAGEKGYAGEGRVSFREFEIQAPAEAGAPVLVSGDVQIKQGRVRAPFLTHPIEDLNCIFLLTREGQNDFGCRTLYGISDLKLSGTISNEPETGPAAYLDLESLYLDLGDLKASLDWDALSGASQSGLGPRSDQPSPAKEVQHLQIERKIAEGVKLETVEIAPSQEPAREPVVTSIVSPARLLGGGRIQVGLSASSFQWDRLRGRELRSTLTFYEGVLSSDAISFDGPGGKYQILRARLKGAGGGVGGYQIEIEPLLMGLEAGALLAVAGGPEDALTGTADLDGRLSFEGRTAGEFSRSLGGQLRIQVMNGRIQQVEKFAILARILALVHWKRLELKRLNTYETGVPFSEISGEFDIKDGVARTTALTLKSPQFDIRTSGTIDFAQQKLALAAHMKITNPADFVISQIPIVREFANALFVPIPIRGSWKDPDVRIGEETKKNPAN